MVLLYIIPRLVGCIGRKKKINITKYAVNNKNDATNYKSTSISYFRLFRFATPLECFLMFLGVVFTILKSISIPLSIVLTGEFTTLLVDRTYRNGTSSNTLLIHLIGGGRILTKASLEENRLAIIEDSIAFGKFSIIVAVFQFLMGIFCVDIFNYTALKQITRIRVKYFNSVIRQEVGWFDSATTEANVSVRLLQDIENIREGIAEKISHFLSLVVVFTTCVINSFCYGWKLTLIAIGYIPILFLTNTIVSRFQTNYTTKESEACAAASHVSEEILGGIRTVAAFCGEENELQRYNKCLAPAQKFGIRRGFVSGIGEGVLQLVFFVSNLLAYWYGMSFVLADRDHIYKEYTPGVVMIVYMSLLMGAENICKIAPFLECFAMARGSAAVIFQVTDKKSRIDPMSDEGKIIKYGVKGDIEFENVGFCYPSRPKMQILNGLNAKIISGQTVALVGSSGNGKSTCLQLLQRFYDPTDGRILIDGHDIKQLNTSWFRSNIAIVNQEPVLFSTTIEENIRYGKPDATRKEVEESAKMSGAHDFIIKLQNSYQTLVGERGCQLSGGQKQRIAIARALIQNPKILLLDEATSALDSHSEKLVQEALDKASKGRTTIVVSHRLSAIRNAGRIIFIEKGKIIEDGTHEELIKLQGCYYKMMKSTKVDDENINQTPTYFDTDNMSRSVDEQEMFDETKYIHDNNSVLNVASETMDKMSMPLNYGTALKRMLMVAKPEWFLLILALIASVVSGAAIAIFSLLIGEFFGAFSITDANEAIETTNKICLAFLVLGILAGISSYIHTYMFIRSGVCLTMRIRERLFGSMLRQDMAWFDDVNNSVGALSGRLTGEAANIQRSIGYPLTVILHAFFTFLIGMIVAFTHVWKMSLVMLPTVFLTIFSVLFEGKYMVNTALVEKEGNEAIVKIATESISNIRTVASLRQEPHIIARYCAQTAEIERTIRKKLSIRGLVNSTGQSMTSFGYAIAFFYGGILVANEGIHYKDVIKAAECLLYGAMLLGQSLAFAPAFVAAFLASQRIFQTIDRRSRIKSPEICNPKADKGSNALFKQIFFNYPTRPAMKILQNTNFEVPEGKTVALVGSSGCGKSTCIQLLQRFYDPDSGYVFLGVDDIARDVALSDLRSRLSIVSQEPILFDRTIAENIAYGDNSRKVDLNDIIAAAKIANIHDFIVSLPMGYETNLGSKGTQLSGGQKQRVAIARALVKNPKVLLLDEATSALDLASEKVVQDALDLARTGRTCLVIAHRLSTIKNADSICVIQNGFVYEQGSHNELMALGGLYSQLYLMQPHVE